MLTTLQVGPLALPTYPLMLLIAGWVGLAVSAKAAGRLGLDADHLYNAGLCGMLAGLIAGRLAHVIGFWSAYRTQPIEIVGLNTRAFLLLPALAAALGVGAWYVQRHRLPWLTVLDACTPGALVASAIISLGALLAGRALGAPAHVPWAIEVWGVPRHPTQVYEMLADLAVALVVLSVLAKPARPGTGALVGLLGYGLSRWLLEPFRAESLLVLGGIRAAQLLGLAVALIALYVIGCRAAAEDRT